ncbi:bisdemethoxycurcumin synthase-like [Oryza glaberrima]|uniref:Chalcone/stilbene synthase N-terminal domain-containing protein n=1 Tax=Oryza glaberrima TaxID=4538 RepID=I1R0N2_ORYGL|nr:bisdemethoxycurcumin synthase-like [Oryza glaberrima]
MATPTAASRRPAVTSPRGGGGDGHGHRHAAVLAIGTANPASWVTQEEYVDWYFRVTNSEHLADLKAKMKRICDKSGIKKRHFHLTEELLADHPDLTDRAQPSLDARLDVAAAAVPELAAAAARKAIAEWGRPAGDITHLVVTTNSGGHVVGADVRLARLLGLRPTVRRTLLYLGGCSAGSGALRLAKDLAENTPGARVLVACAELNLIAFRGPEDGCLDTLILQGIFGDGAGAAVVGADPVVPVERPIFYMASASQTTIPGTEHAITGQLRKGGLDYHIAHEMPSLVGEHIAHCVADALAPLGIGIDVDVDGGGGWNGLFWAVHPGGRAILDSVEARLALAPGKLAASRRVLGEFGNMAGATVFFVLDELPRARGEGERRGCEWGVAVAFGPGVTVEAMVLRAVHF